ncbi:MAG: hypothetical protein LBB89_11075 [Treponema sp.]|jgi:hypothetical protein|nr:hypothetical protein [Treponema sp.]
MKEDIMDRNYSIMKIMKNKIGLGSIFIWAFSIIIFFITLLFVNDLSTKIYLFIVVAFVFLFIPVYSIINIIKIIKFFKNGIEAKAIVRDNIYAAKGIRQLPFEALGEELEQTGDIYAYRNKWGRREYIKTGIIYEYKINEETYKSSSTFLINSDTMFLKNGSIINILANPKNKNDAIIKDIYIKGIV